MRKLLAGVILLLLLLLPCSDLHASKFTVRDCLDGDTRSLLSRLEARFGQVKLVKTCVPGARMPSGHVSWHAKNKAFDFHVPKGARHGDVMTWLKHNSPGVTIGYSGKLAGIVHTDTGTFRMVIYRAASHEAGERAVETWKARGQYAADVASGFIVAERVPLLPLYEEPVLVQQSAPRMVEDWTDVAEIRPTNIFDRFLASMQIKVQPWVRLTCADGSPMPDPLQRLVLDAADHFGKTVTINSAWRPRWYNEMIRKRGARAARNSEHIQCTRMRGAIDFRVVGVPPIKVFEWVKVNQQKYVIGGLGYYGSGGHIHADTRPISFVQKHGKRVASLVTWGLYKRRARGPIYAKKKYHHRVAHAT